MIPASSVEVLHLIFKTHLDIGFTDLARNIVHQYFESFIPTAIETARILREEGASERFVWTTGSWLIYEYLERVDRQQRKRVEAAIEAGDLVWHGLPFTTHTELMDASLFRFGLSLSQRLDARFGKKTIAAKMTDVPGHTRSMIPLLAEAGIQFLHLGANPASTPPDVPPVFVWRDLQTGTRVLVMYQKGAYGDLMQVPGLADAIAFAHTNDNHGPQTINEVRSVFAAMRKRFPNANVIASTMDAFASRLLAVESTLPVITQEMGDTWIHGVGTDSAKVAQFRELSRLRRNWLETGQAKPDDPRLIAFSRALLMIPEHTWGMDIKLHLPDTVNYSADQLRRARETEMFKKVEESWGEQRAYLNDALRALGDSRLGEQAKAQLQQVQPNRPSKARLQPQPRVSQIIETRCLEIGFDEVTGAIIHLRSKQNGREWASAAHPIGWFRYQTFSQADYDRYWRQYIRNKRRTRAWSLPDNTKPGMAAAGSPSRYWQPSLSALYSQRDQAGCQLLLELTAPDEARTQYGCPALITIEISLPDASPTIDFRLQWFDKPACRLPEALWFSFVPAPRVGGRWTMDKMGQPVSPLDVVRNGNRKLHAVDSGVSYADRWDKLSIKTLDAPLVAIGTPSLLNFSNRQPHVGGGVHFNLFNNIWGTNFPMWYEDDTLFRFQVNFSLPTTS